MNPKCIILFLLSNTCFASFLPDYLPPEIEEGLQNLQKTDSLGTITKWKLNSSVPEELRKQMPEKYHASKTKFQKYKKEKLVSWDHLISKSINNNLKLEYILLSYPSQPVLVFFGIYRSSSQDDYKIVYSKVYDNIFEKEAMEILKLTPTGF